MDEETEERSLAFSGVLLDPDGLGVLDGDRVVKHVPRDNLQTIEVRSGLLSAHPFLQLAFGAVLVWLGLSPAKSLLDGLREGETTVDVVAFLALLIPLGAWLVYDALKRGHYLIVESGGGRLKIPLKGRPSAADVDAFVGRAKSELGYDIIDGRQGGSTWR
jgi:hypothetical protein